MRQNKFQLSHDKCLESQAHPSGVAVDQRFVIHVTHYFTVYMKKTIAAQFEDFKSLFVRVSQ
jgi:hypothetical protein